MKVIIFSSLVALALTGCAGANGGAGPDWDAAVRNFQNYQNGVGARQQQQQQLMPMPQTTICRSYPLGNGAYRTVCQ